MMGLTREQAYQWLTRVQWGAQRARSCLQEGSVDGEETLLTRLWKSPIGADRALFDPQLNLINLTQRVLDKGISKITPLDLFNIHSIARTSTIFLSAMAAGDAPYQWLCVSPDEQVPPLAKRTEFNIVDFDEVGR